jgi:hypothetical protein
MMLKATHAVSYNIKGKIDTACLTSPFLSVHLCSSSFPSYATFVSARFWTMCDVVAADGRTRLHNMKTNDAGLEPAGVP